MLQQIEDRLVVESGPPPDARRLSDADEVRMWGLRDPSVDYDTMASRLMTEGIPQAEAEQLAVIKEHPEWLPLFTTPTNDAAKADQLARLAETPYRWSLLADLEPHEQVQKSERLAARHQRALHGDTEPAQAPVAPPPPPVAPSMMPPVPPQPVPPLPMGPSASAQPMPMAGSV